MPITHNLGRINKCKIVGCKDRFIEVRCIEEECTENCFECVNGAAGWSCVGQVGGQYDTMADCLASMYTNSCITAGMTDSGIFTAGYQVYWDWYFANHPNDPITDYYFEQPTCVGGPTCCEGPNGGYFVYFTHLQIVQDISGVITQMGPNFASMLDMVNWANTNGCAGTLTTSMTAAQLNAAMSLCLCEPPPTSVCDPAHTDSGVAGTFVDMFNYFSTTAPATAYSTVYYEDTSATPSGWNCIGPNGGVMGYIIWFTVYDLWGNITYTNSGSFNDLVNWLNANGGGGYSAGQSFATMNTMYDTYIGGGGSTVWFNARHVPCNCIPRNSTCDAKNDTGLQGVNQHTLAFDWIVSSSMQNQLINNFIWEGNVSTSNSGNQRCIGPNGFDVFYFTEWKLYNNIVLTHTFDGTTDTYDDVIAWCNANIGSGFVNTMNYNAFNAHLISFWGGLGGKTRLALEWTWCLCTDPPNDCDIFVYGEVDECECTGCGSGPGASWECYEGPAGSYCADPLDGSGQYPTEPDCLAALASGQNSNCSAGGDWEGTGNTNRVHAVPGTIFTTAISVLEYYTTPANGLSGTDANTLQFEVYLMSGTYPQGAYCNLYGAPANTTCCEGPNSTVADPTIMMFLPFLGFKYGFDEQNSIASAMAYCCPHIYEGGYSSDVPFMMIGGFPNWFTTADYESLYGWHPSGIVDVSINQGLQSWSWDEVLADAMAANVTGVTMNTVLLIGGTFSAIGAFKDLTDTWLATNPVEDDCTSTQLVQCAAAVPSNNNTAVVGINDCNHIFICHDVLACWCVEACDNITYDCDPSTCLCYDPGTGLGAYSGATALADCVAACCDPEESWDCNPDGSCSDPQNGAGQWTDANSGGNPGDGLAACLASGGTNTCDPATDNGIGPIALGDKPSYDLLVTNGQTAIVWHTYWYESTTPYTTGNCEGVNGGNIYSLYHYNINKNGILQYTDNTGTATVDSLVAWCNTNIGAGFLNTMSWIQMELHSRSFPGWSFTQGHPPNIHLGHIICQCTDCGGSDPWECLPESGCTQMAGGQYGSQGACEAALTYFNSCDGTTLVDGGMSFGTLAQAQSYITTQANGLTSVDVTTLSTYINNSNCTVIPNDDCPLVSTAVGVPQIQFDQFICYNPSNGAQLAGLQTSYTLWDDFLTDAQAIPIASISASSSYWQAYYAVIAHYGTGQGILELNYRCCDCTEGCTPPSTRAHKSCLVLHLDATDTSTVTLQGPPSLSGLTPIQQVMNKAYNGVGLPIDMTAYYTWDTIDNDPLTAPDFDTVTWPWHTFLFNSKDGTPEYLIANTNGPNPPRLQPDTNPDTDYDKGWTIFFHRATSATEWINEKSWLMGDDWTVSDDANKHHASGLKPHGQPYCKSNYYGHNHADSTVPSSEYEASPLNELNNTGYRTLKNNIWYVHWIVATEQLPLGNNIFNVTWGIGSTAQFTDTIAGINLDMVLANINTRNRGKDGFIPGQGFISEIRAYDCAFDKNQIVGELTTFENKYGYGTLNIPNQLPPGCGDPYASTVFDGVDQTHASVHTSSSISPGATGFTAAFWIKMNDCTENEEDACLFEKVLIFLMIIQKLHLDYY